ncbi:hypothetical protein JCM18237_05490 [Halorubrum luteum]
MMKYGGKLVGAGEEQFREQLGTERGPKEIKRLVAELKYKSGLPPAKIQDQYLTKRYQLIRSESPSFVLTSHHE